MAAKKSMTKGKRGVPAPSGAAKNTVVAKKKHVRELAKARRWTEIERLYGKKMATKAKTYAENCVVKTAQEIARDILVKNGLLPSASQTKREMVDATIRPSSPETLTKEQQELIDKRRLEALERRRRGMAQRPPVVIQPDSAENTRRSVQLSVVPLQRQLNPPLQPSRTYSTGQPRVKTHRVVTPENLPMTNVAGDTEQMRPEYFWDDLEAAAEIVQWENEHMAEVALVQSPAKTSRNVGTDQHGLGQQIYQNEPKTQPLAVSTISQELAAAAEIIQWENEREVPPEVPAAFDRPDDSSESDPGLDAPQFQLLPVHVTDDFEQHEHNTVQPKCPQTNNITSRLPNSQQKRPLAESPPAPPHSSVISAHPGARNQCHATSSYPSENQGDPTAEFIDKHILEDKLEVPVLEFLDMMLA